MISVNSRYGLMFYIWVIIICLLQITILSEVNLLVVLAVFSGLRKGPMVGLLTSASIGLFAEIFSSTMFGLNVLLFSLVGLLSGIAKRRILYYKENIFMEILFSFCGVMLFYFLYFVLTSRIQASIFSVALFSSAVSPLVSRLASWRVGGYAS